MKLTITADQAAKFAAREGDLDPTTGKPDYIPGFVPSAADRHYERRLAALHTKLATYEEILRVVCGHLELPQSESGPADDVRLYDRALEAADEYTKQADADLAVNRAARFKAEAEVERLRIAARTGNGLRPPTCEHDWFDCSNAAAPPPAKSCRKCGWTCGGDETRGVFIVWPWLQQRQTSTDNNGGDRG